MLLLKYNFCHTFSVCAGSGNWSIPAPILNESQYKMRVCDPNDRSTHQASE